MRVDFIANASHELRTPLASLLGFVDTLQGPARDDARAREKFLAIMREQGRRMARLVDDLLSLSRIEQNQHVRPEAPIDLALVARHVADTLAPLAEEMGVDLKVDAAAAGHRRRRSRRIGARGGKPDRKRDQIWRGPDGSNAERVEIAVTKTAREGWLSVRDYGRGIAPEHLPRLTERFYRIDAGQSRIEGRNRPRPGDRQAYYGPPSRTPDDRQPGSAKAPPSPPWLRFIPIISVDCLCITNVYDVTVL